MDYARRFGGIARTYGEAALARFAASHVAVIGVGGVGSWAVEALARSGIGRLTLIDLDHVAESNVNRQLQAIECDFGKAKVQALAERIGQINPDCRVDCIEDFITPDNLDELLPGQPDQIIDCIDNFRAKTALIAHCRRRKRPIVTVGGAGGQTDPTRIRLSDLSRTEQDPLLAKTRRSLRRDFGFPSNPKRRFSIPAVWSDEPQRQPAAGNCDNSGLNCGGFGSVMTVTATMALVAVSHTLNRLADGNNAARGP